MGDLACQLSARAAVTDLIFELVINEAPTISSKLVKAGPSGWRHICSGLDQVNETDATAGMCVVPSDRLFQVLLRLVS